MISRLIAYSLRHRAAVIAAYLVLGVWGVFALQRSPVDAIPDLSDPQVIVFTDWSGHSAQEVEDQVTYPVTVNLQGLPGVRVVRSQSAFGFSMVYALLEEGVLVVMTLLVGEARVVRQGRVSALGEPLGERIDFLARGAVDDAGLARVTRQDLQELLLQHIA